jgi:hypothetical protein
MVRDIARKVPVTVLPEDWRAPRKSLTGVGRTPGVKGFGGARATQSPVRLR